MVKPKGSLPTLRKNTGLSTRGDFGRTNQRAAKATVEGNKFRIMVDPL